MNISAITTTAVEQSQKTNQRSSLDAKPEQQPVGKSLEDILLQVDGLGNFGITEINQVA